MNEAGGHPTGSLCRPKWGASSRRLPWLLGCWLCAVSLGVHGTPLVSTDNPTAFFTNVANRLMQSQLNLSLDRIQLYPTNQYTPSVHRLLQVTANLYDAMTNRTFGVPSATNGFPSVFRPVFASLNNGNQIYITGYQEVVDANALLNEPVLDLGSAKDRSVLRASSQMVWGIPLVIGARKGLPNFNKFSLQTQAQVTRKLQFHRANNSNTAPVNELDQMFVVGITNSFGVEAWNSYATPFPRSLRMVVIPELTLVLTNLETGKLLNPSTVTYVSPVVATNIPANIWLAYNPGNEGLSFILPLASGPGVPFTNMVFLTNATYSASSDAFVPLTGNFERTPGTSNLYVPHWQLNLRTRLRLALVDTSLIPNRIVDYVNLDSAVDPLSTRTVDLASALASDVNCGTLYTPSGANGSMWCTNRMGSSTADSTPTFGIMNQIAASMGQVNADWTASHNAFPSGMSIAQVEAFFMGQFTPGYFAQSNTFAAPYQPFRNIYVNTEWEANDPLVHYMISDLRNLQQTNNFVVGTLNNLNAPLALLGHVNRRYEPWGGTPGKIGVGVNAPPYALTVKDPVPSMQGRSDDWDFPTNPIPDGSWLGRVHRGTPWQTLYLKATSATLPSWMQWTGNGQLLTNWNGGYGLTHDAVFTHPTNDWRLASLLVSLLSTNDPRTLRSVNQPNAAAWCGLLDGMVVLTNAVPDQLTPIIMSSNSPQAATISAALDAMRASQPSQRFNTTADLLATAELSTASPWLDFSSPTQPNGSPSDEAYEAIPAQLLSLLRPDSVGSVSAAGGVLQIQFSGADGYSYAVQSSLNLLNWIPLSTNHPTNGSFSLTDTPLPGSPGHFYRSLLLP